MVVAVCMNLDNCSRFSLHWPGIAFSHVTRWCTPHLCGGCTRRNPSSFPEPAYTNRAKVDQQGLSSEAYADPGGDPGDDPGGDPSRLQMKCATTDERRRTE